MSELFKEEVYRKRLIDSIIEEYLQSCGAICIEGPKWCGKIWTSAFHSNSEFFVGNSFNNKTIFIGKNIGENIVKLVDLLHIIL